MVSVKDVFPTKYLKADDLQGREVPVTIISAQVEEIGQGDRKLVLYFKDKQKGMVCNKTNADRLSFSYGDDTDGWLGKAAILYGEVVSFQGKPTLGLRVRVPGAGAYIAHNQQPPAMAGAAPPASENPADGFGDEVPF